MTGFTFAHGTVSDMTSPTSMPAHLMAFKKPAKPTLSNDSALRSAIISVAKYYLRMAQSKTPAEMEALIWQGDSVDGVDHGQSCAAFASLTLALGAQAVGQQSWVTGGGSYPWPLHQWADVRVQTNPASPNVVSMQQDAQMHQRWHAIGDGYQPQPGDWVMFDGHVEVVTRYTGAALYTVGGDSLPNFTVNAHKFSTPLDPQGVLGFVNNGELLSAGGQQASSPGGGVAAASGAAATGSEATAYNGAAAGSSVAAAGSAQVLRGSTGNAGAAAIPGTLASALRPANGGQVATGAPGELQQRAGAGQAGSGTAVIPGAQVTAAAAPRSSTPQQAPAYHRHNQPPVVVPGTTMQQAFISQVAPGAIAAQQRYGIPAAVTIAQAIDESGWGQSELATSDYNLFGIKGTGPAGTDMRPTQEYENGIWVTRTAGFRVYHNMAESITDHGQLLANGQSYQHAMADRHVPDAFASDLTGVYATDPNYGSNLIALMRLYNLYRYDAGAPAAVPQAAVPQAAVPQAAVPQAAVPQAAVAEPQAAVPGAAVPLAAVPGIAAVPHVAEPQVAAPRIAAVGAAASGAGTSGAGVWGGTSIPGLSDAFAGSSVNGRGTSSSAGSARSTAARTPKAAHRPAARIAPRGAQISTRRYVSQVPRAVTADFIATAKAPLTRAQPLYQDVASRTGIHWELLAACDWMQCKADPRYSPVYGEKLGTTNPSGTVYRTKSAALAQCASDLIELASAVYLINVTGRRGLSVRELANVFAAFRWGGLLRIHDISAMEFPYSVEGLTAQHLKMRWPDIRSAHAPDRPGTRFRMPFGAVPVVLSLGYPAVA